MLYRGEPFDGPRDRHRCAAPDRGMAGGGHDALGEETEGTEITVSQEKRRNGDARSS